jgi:hypothetical protein
MNRRAALIAALIVLSYGCLIWYLVSTMASSLLAVILCVPYTAAYGLAYAFGDGFIYIALAIEALLLWGAVYMLVSAALPKQRTSQRTHQLRGQAGDDALG